MSSVGRTMTFRAAATAILALLLLEFSSASSLAQTPAASPDFRQLLQQLAEFSPDPCLPANGNQKTGPSVDIESDLFDEATDVVTQALNVMSAGAKSPRDRAEEGLKRLEEMSAETNSAWPKENRFHFEILDLPPTLVVQLGVRSQATFVVFAIPEEEKGKPNHAWRMVGSYEESGDHDTYPSSLGLFSLHRGPSGNARFLAKSIFSGCAGSLGVSYDALEWSAKGSGELDPIIKQDGAFGLDDKVADFPQIGKLHTSEPLVTLPYCWFSSIDTWDNPSLCAVDTYDLAGDEVRFRSRTYNRPDLVPIAKGIEYAQQRDYAAVIGYCASDEVAHKLVRELPPDIYPDDLRVTRTGDGKEHVEVGDPTAYSFDVERHADRWVIVGFSME